MAESSPRLEFEVDISHLIHEDGKPVESPLQEKQMRLLTEPLYTSWKPDFPFVAMADVGLYYALHAEALVPDVMVSTHVEMPKDLWLKKNRSYLVWEYGKVPDVVIEVVSSPDGEELTTRMKGYLDRHIPFYIVFDPKGFLGERVLRSFEYSPSGYVEMVKPFFSLLGLGLTLWKGEFEHQEGTWLRWCDGEGQPLPTGKEASESQQTRADEEKARADRMAEENIRLLERLRAAGLEP